MINALLRKKIYISTFDILGFIFCQVDLCRDESIRMCQLSLRFGKLTFIIIQRVHIVHTHTQINLHVP